MRANLVLLAFGRGGGNWLFCRLFHLCRAPEANFFDIVFVGVGFGGSDGRIGNGFILEFLGLDLAGGYVNGEGRRGLPTFAVAFLDIEDVAFAVGFQAEVLVFEDSRGSGDFGQAVTGGADHPAFTTGFRFIGDVTTAGGGFTGVQNHFAVGVRVKPEFGDGSWTAVFCQRAVAPRSTTIGGNEEKGVMGERVLRFTDDPAMFQIVKLGLTEASHADPGSRFSPGETTVLAAEEDRGDGAGGGMEIACQIELSPDRNDRRKLQEDSAGVLLGTEQADGLQLFFGAEVGDFDGFTGVLQDDWFICRGGHGESDERRQAAGEQDELQAETSHRLAQHVLRQFYTRKAQEDVGQGAAPVWHVRQLREQSARRYDGSGMPLKFRDRLKQELEERRRANPRYSLRAFARFLEADHATVSQILRGKRAIPATLLREWAAKLGLENEEAAAWIAAEQLPEPGDAERERQLRHWTAEAIAIMSDRTHWKLVEFCRKQRTHPDSRRIAEDLLVTPDQVNMAFSRLLGLRLMTTDSAGLWLHMTPDATKTEKQFLRLALARVRAQAAEYNVKLPLLRSKSHAESSVSVSDDFEGP